MITFVPAISQASNPFYLTITKLAAMIYELFYAFYDQDCITPSARP